MESIATIFDHLLGALFTAFLSVVGMVTEPAQRIGWPHVLSAAYLAGLIYVARTRRSEVAARVSLAGFARFCLPREVWSQPSAWLDVRFFFVNMTLLTLAIALMSSGFPTLNATASAWSERVFGAIPGLPLFESVPDGAAATVLLSLVAAAWFDFVAYAIHYAQHRIPLLWEFHKIHHSAPVLHPLTNYREHLVDNLVAIPGAVVASGIMAGLVGVLFENPRAILSPHVMGAPLFVFLFNVLGYNLRHSHIWWAWPPTLGRIFGSPANHQIHHSREVRHLNKNFGFVFAVWDWMFGTLYLPPREREEFEFGLADDTGGEYDSIVHLYFLPFSKLYGRMRDQWRGHGAAA